MAEHVARQRHVSGRAKHFEAVVGSRRQRLVVAHVAAQQGAYAATAGAIFGVGHADGVEDLVRHLAVVHAVVHVHCHDVISLEQGDADTGHAALGGLRLGQRVRRQLRAILWAALRPVALTPAGVVRRLQRLGITLVLRLQPPAEEDRKVAQGRRDVDVPYFWCNALHVCHRPLAQIKSTLAAALSVMASRRRSSGRNSSAAGMP